ncbi:MAG: hypothetical protein HQL19_05350 [Candidatus Omnitrophica bacterium]|nr:hypothetical protein [Candidatus Omnitrophota bacterium]
MVYGKNIGIIVFCMMLLMGQRVFAQGLSSRGARPVVGRQQEAPLSASAIATRMKQALHLTDEQVNSIIPILESELTQIKALIDQNTDRAGARSRIEAIQQDTQTKLAQVLTQEQLTGFQKTFAYASQGASQVPLPGRLQPAALEDKSAVLISGSSSASGARSPQGDGVW